MKKTKESGKLSLYLFSDYRDYIRAYLDQHSEVRGTQQRLAVAAKCKPSYLSQVLRGHVQLTLDQAAALTTYWGFDEDQIEYFLCIVQLDRAADKALKSFVQTKINRLRKKYQEVSSRIETTKRVEVKDEIAVYYSSWILPVLHIMTSIPNLQTIDQMQEKLMQPRAVIEESLKELIKLQFVEKQNQRYVCAQNSSIHISKESPLLNHYHFQWRHLAMNRILHKDSRNKHYSAVFALSKDDVEKLRELLLNFIEQSRQLIGPSKEEELMCLNLDLFHV